MKGTSQCKKESGDAVMPCTLGKVRNWNTVDDDVQSHESEEKGNKEYTSYC